MITRRDLLSAGALLIAPKAHAAPLPLNVILHGREEPEPELIELTAGPVTMSFQPDTGFLRYVALGDREVLRGVYVAVRDRAWGTVAPRITDIRHTRRSGGFHLAFNAVCNEGDIAFQWKGALQGSPDGTIRFSMDGAAESTFLRNRIGFCVLHPMRECAGQPCTVEHTDGGIEQGRFPMLISPHQPFKDIRAITHNVTSGVSATVRFEGDVFEMEDHRNWTDSNFKTYCTPLERPYPVRIEKGTRVAQTVTLTLKRESTASPPRRASKTDPVRLDIAANARKIPRIGFGLGTADPTGEESKRLRLLKPAHLRADIHLASPEWKDQFGRSVRVAASVDAPLECALFVTDEADTQLRAVAAEASRSGARVVRWLIFHETEPSTSGRWIGLARKHLRGAAAIVSGTNQFFTELNRGRPQAESLDALCYSINPQVHAFDNASLVENLEAQAETVRTAQSFAAGRPVAVSPVTLLPRTNPNADPRQRSLFGAAWTLGSIRYLAQPETDSITYYELTGPAGLMSGEVFPLYHVFADLAEFAGGEIVPLQSSDPLRAEGLLLSSGDRKRLLLANMTSRRQRVLLPRPVARSFSVRRLDATTFSEASSTPGQWRKSSGRFAGGTLTLEPFSVLTGNI